MCVKNEVVDVVELVLVVEVELVEVVLVEDVLVLVVVVVVDDVVVEDDVVPVVLLVDSVVGTACWMKGSLLWKLEYLSAGETTIGCWLASATDSTVVATWAWFSVVAVALDPPPPNPRQPVNRMEHPATRSAAPRRCMCLRDFIFSVL
jgi:hypothetical protein